MLAVGIAIGLVLGMSLPFLAAAELDNRGLSIHPATTPTPERLAGGERPRLATSLQPTRVPSRCAESAKVSHQTSLVALRADADSSAAYYVLGTVRNTCTVPLRVALEMLGVADQGSLSSLGIGEVLALKPGQERAFVSDLGRHPVDEIAALIVVPRCGLDTGYPGGSAGLRRCQELVLERHAATR